MIFACLVCGKKDEAFKSENRKYCSNKCAAVGRTYLDNGHCEVCGRPIRNDGRARKYCDQTCETVNKRREGVIKRTMKCKYCDKLFVREKSQTKRQFCCSRCAMTYRWKLKQ